MKTAESGEDRATRQCWECLKRRLVCDHTLPHCKKCQKAGKECPGYDEQKPLQWVQPGKVTSRRRKKDSPPKIYTVPTKEAPKLDPQKLKQLKSFSITSTPGSDLSDVSLVASLPVDGFSIDRTQQIQMFFDHIHSQGFFTRSRSTREEEWGHLAKNFDESTSRELAYYNADLTDKIYSLFAIGNRHYIEEVLAKGSLEDAARMVGGEKNPLKRLDSLLQVLKMQDVPNYTHLRCDTNEIVQSVSYYNERIRPLARRSEELTPNPALMIFPLAALNLLPPAIHHTLVCLSVNHYIHSLPIGADKSITADNRSKIYQHRGAAIRALSQYVGKDRTRCNDLSISSILVFMSMELQNPPMSDWRSHARGVSRLIEMRGGIRTLLEQSPYLSPTLSIFVLIMTMANTCSPPWDQLDISSSPTAAISHLHDLYTLIFPFTLCPPVLFFSMVRVSHLRARASQSIFSGTMETSHTLEAHDLLTVIEAFSVDDWAQPGAHYDEWVLIGNIYQSAIALYCTMSFQSLRLFPADFEMNSMRTVHADRLLAYLHTAVDKPRLVNFMCWPLTVAGVEAGYRGTASRYWIGKQLGELSRVLGTGGPLKSQAILRRYWQKEEPGWDKCFDRPYVFVV